MASKRAADSSGDKSGGVTMKNKVVSAEEAVALVRDGDTLINTGFIGSAARPRTLLVALEQPVPGERDSRAT